MDRSHIVTLVSGTYTTDALGQRVKTDTFKDVYCSVRSVSASEWFAGGQNGLNPQYQLEVFKYDYSGETEAVLNGERYSIYRTYERQNDLIELYLERKSGV